jgi:hypothetical protein
LVSSAEAAAAAVRREMTAYIDPQDVRTSFQDLVGKVKSPELDRLKTAQAQIQNQAEKVTEKLAPLSPGASVIHADVEHYLRDTYSWQPD